MKPFFLLLFTFVTIFLSNQANAQNVTLNILSQNEGVMKIDSIIRLEITINNMSSRDFVPAYKLKPRISLPQIVVVNVAGHDLPKGWAIISNTGSDITLSNGSDMMPALSRRTIFISLKGNTTGGPHTISGQMLFANGVAPGITPGAATTGDSASDNNSTTTCKIIK